jgi:hypothetical protein
MPSTCRASPTLTLNAAGSGAAVETQAGIGSRSATACSYDRSGGGSLAAGASPPMPSSSGDPPRVFRVGNSSEYSQTQKVPNLSGQTGSEMALAGNAAMLLAARPAGSLAFPAEEFVSGLWRRNAPDAAPFRIRSAHLARGHSPR